MAAVAPSLLAALLYAALAVLVGALGMYWLVLPRCGLVATERAPVQRAAATAAMVAAAVVLLVVPARLALQVADFLEPGEAWRPALDAILFTTPSGKAAQLAMVWSTATLLAFSVARVGRARGWRVATITVIVIAMTPGLGGHPAAAEQPLIAMTVATMHVIGAGLWLGTLFHIWRTTARASVATAERLVAAFHRVAMAAVSLVALSGGYAALTMLGSPQDLVRTSWGILLATKLVLVLAALALGFVHWRTAELKYSRGAHAAVTRTIGVEIGIAVGIIVMTGFLAGSTPPSAM